MQAPRLPSTDHVHVALFAEDLGKRDSVQVGEQRDLAQELHLP